jgi:hypothetical protein
MYKIWSYGRDDWIKFPTLNAAKAYMERLYKQGLIRGSHTELVYGPDGEHITLQLSFGVVMERRSTASMAWPVQQSH